MPDVIRGFPASLVRRVARTLKRLPARCLHPLRRKRTLHGLTRRGRPENILFVCHGNICRSPYAAGAFWRLLPIDGRAHLRVVSAGLVGPNRSCPAEAQRVAAQRGIDLSTHRSRTLTTELVAEADIIFVMDVRQARALCRAYRIPHGRVVTLGDVDPKPIDTRGIRDPVGGSEQVFQSTYDRIDRCLAAVAPLLSPPDATAGTLARSR